MQNLLGTGRGRVLRRFLRRGFFRTGDGDDLVVVHQPGGQEAQRGTVGPDVAGDVEPRRRGEEGEGVGLREAQRRRDGGHPLAAGRLQHGLPLLIGQSLRQRGGQGFLGQRVHGLIHRRAYCVICLR